MAHRYDQPLVRGRLKRDPQAETVVLPLPSELSALLQQIAAGDQAAFAAFYDATCCLIFGMVLSATGDAPNAEALTEAVYVAAWATAPSFDPAHDEPTAWLQRIARRRIELTAAGT